MRLSYFREHSGTIKTLTLRQDPFRYGLGIYRGTDGQKWDIIGLIGGAEPYVQARRVDNSPLYRTDDDAAHSNYTCEWLPYNIKIDKMIQAEAH